MASNSIPALFEPITIRGMTLKNRIVVAPMCQYSCNDGFANTWHQIHATSRIVGGAALFIMEATGVSAIGRISPNCLGLYKDEHVEMLKTIVDQSHELGGKIGIQLAHAGRKASLGRLWDSGRLALSEDRGGWEVVGPSELQFDDIHKMPREITIPEIEETIKDFIEAAKRAVKAGFDVIEIHGAHGYLIHSFMSPVSNLRTDMYGGSFENRTRLLLQIVDGVRGVIPEEMPLFVRLSCEDYMEEGWTSDDTVKVSQILKDHGVDLIDCSTGGTKPIQNVHGLVVEPGYQVKYSVAIKEKVDILTGAVGKLEDPILANKVIEEKKADLVLIGRAMMGDPYWALRAAKTLGYANAGIPPQYGFAINL
ncbi:predicted protein [Naegleria gruberi]|uniref:Predicted protein n=1 Tax=Naegleria gruberi TaxID=5762 RepID=D2VZI9_NAEGR|nr:uncharacterized protein NAEGRDRAFT_74504 [Naegleria gruberi]EFC37799.1 predicted protein [Naegleria gruberi]|eukprot:XP_002670543.1 predicted protein [Naegleria gruberi strain NEG-M]